MPPPQHPRRSSEPLHRTPHWYLLHTHIRTYAPIYIRTYIPTGLMDNYLLPSTLNAALSLSIRPPVGILSIAPPAGSHRRGPPTSMLRS